MTAERRHCAFLTGQLDSDLHVLPAPFALFMCALSTILWIWTCARHCSHSDCSDLIVFGRSNGGKEPSFFSEVFSLICLLKTLAVTEAAVNCWQLRFLAQSTKPERVVGNRCRFVLLQPATFGLHGEIRIRWIQIKSDHL